MSTSSSSSSSASTSVTEIVKGGKGLVGPAFDGSGRLHCVGNIDGRIYIEENNVLHTIGETGGQPTGVCFDHMNNLYICDTAHTAILVLKEDGSLHSVVQDYEGKAFKGPNSATIDSAGNLYFTDSGPFGETSLVEPTGSVFLVTGEAHNRILRPIVYERLAYPTGITIGPKESMVFVAEMATNRVLRFTQKPIGVWHPSVFIQFQGRMGPTAIVWDDNKQVLYVARFDINEVTDKGIISVVNIEGQIIKEITLPGGPEITGLTIAPDGQSVVASESSTNTLYRVPV